jgi:CHASE2 domain-containing sensor protein
MKRFLIFTALFPPLALAVFTAPDGFKNLLDWLGTAYMVAIIPAWLTAGVDWTLSARPTYLRVLGTAVAGAVMSGSVAFFMWGGFREFFPALMAVLVGAVPAAVCSWLSDKSMRSRICVSNTEARQIAGGYPV